MKTVVVAGALANKPGNAGEAWVRMGWARGLRRFGFDVWFVESLDPGLLAARSSARWPARIPSMPMFPSWHAYSKIGSSLNRSGIKTVHGFDQTPGSSKVTS